MVRTSTWRLAGQSCTGPNGVASQSTARQSARTSPGPAKSVAAAASLARRPKRRVVGGSCAVIAWPCHGGPRARTQALARGRAWSAGRGQRARGALSERRHPSHCGRRVRRTHRVVSPRTGRVARGAGCRPWASESGSAQAAGCERTGMEATRSAREAKATLAPRSRHRRALRTKRSRLADGADVLGGSMAPGEATEASVVDRNRRA